MRKNIKSKQSKLKDASTTITSINATIQSPPLFSFVKKSKHAWTQKLWTMSTISKYSPEWWQRLQIVSQRISLFSHSALSAWYYSLTISMGWIAWYNFSKVESKIRKHEKKVWICLVIIVKALTVANQHKVTCLSLNSES